MPRRGYAAFSGTSPGAYQNVLSQFDTPELRHVTLPLGSGFHSDPRTAALNDMGVIEYVGGLDSKLALYQLKPDSVAVVQSFFEECRREKDAQTRARLIERLQNADPAERNLLQLFGTPGPTAPGEPHHPQLEHPVYRAVGEPERAGVLTHIRNPTKRGGTAQSYTETIALTPAAVESVEQLILAHPAARTEITLDLSQIAGSGSSGSGAPTSMTAGVPWPSQIRSN